MMWFLMMFINIGYYLFDGCFFYCGFEFDLILEIILLNEVLMVFELLIGIIGSL